MKKTLLGLFLAMASLPALAADITVAGADFTTGEGGVPLPEGTIKRFVWLMGPSEGELTQVGVTANPRFNRTVSDTMQCAALVYEIEVPGATIPVRGAVGPVTCRDFTPVPVLRVPQGSPVTIDLR
jgi:hypothetical protein